MAAADNWVGLPPPGAPRTLSAMPRILRCVLVVLVVAAPGGGLLTDATAQLACAFDTTALATPTTIRLGLVPHLDAAAPAHLREHATLVAQAIREHFVAPGQLSLPLWARIAAPPTDEPVTFEIPGGLFFAEVTFRLTDEGRLRGRDVAASTVAPELNRAIVTAVHRADSARAFPTPGRGEEWDGGRVVLRMVSWDTPVAGGVGLISFESARLRADSAVRIVSIPQPRYPGGARLIGAGDVVDLLYVVGADGRTVRGSIRVVGGRDRQFIAAASEAVERGRFEPARIAGCPVPVQVAQRIQFHMAPR